MQTTTEDWVYQGARLTVKGQKRYAWQNPEGATWYFAKVSASMIGGTYRVHVERTGENGATVHGQPVYLRGPYDETPEQKTQRAGWEAAEAVALAQLAAASRERSAAKRKALDEAMEPLEAIARTARTGAQRDALVAHVLRRLYEVW